MRICNVRCPGDCCYGANEQEVSMVTCKMKNDQSALLPVFAPELQNITSNIRLLKLSTWGGCRGLCFLTLVTWSGNQEVGLPPPLHSHSSRLSVSLFRLHSCTEQLYTRLSTWPVCLVFVSVKKILHLYLQQLNRGQLSTCVVWWRVLEFDASRGGGEAFLIIFFILFLKKTNK